MHQDLILLAESDHQLRSVIKGVLLGQGFNVIDTSSKSHVGAMLQSRNPGLLLVGTSWESSDDGMKIVDEINLQDHDTPIILIARQSSEDQVIQALRAGVKDYFKIPFCYNALMDSVKRCVRRGHLSHFNRFDPTSSDEFTSSVDMVGVSTSIQEITSYIKKLARTESNVLITGETGTGKELAAELLHDCSRRKDKNLVCVNCAAIPENLIESELFGSEKGAFTGASSLRKGKFEQADKGTIFLDEIGDMSVYAQAKILRAIDSKKICRVGGSKEITVNARGVAATNHDLEQLVEEKKFRDDLYYRLNVGRVQLPPLRERKEDIPCLVNHFVGKLNRATSCNVYDFTDESWQYFTQYDWPGNVRELKNMVEATFIDVPGNNIERLSLPDYLKRKIDSSTPFVVTERDKLLSALSETNWNKSKAANKLQWSRMTLYRKMKRYKIANR